MYYTDKTDKQYENKEYNALHSAYVTWDHIFIIYDNWGLNDFFEGRREEKYSNNDLEHYILDLMLNNQILLKLSLIILLMHKIK